jgi:hypothetical protein
MIGWNDWKNKEIDQVSICMGRFLLEKLTVRSAGQEIHRLLWNPKFDYRVYKSFIPIPNLSQMNLLQKFLPYFSYARLRPGLPVFDSRQDRVRTLGTTCRPTLWSTQTPNSRVPVSFIGMNLTVHLHLCRGRECVELCFPSLNTSAWRGALLNVRCTFTSHVRLIPSSFSF